MSLIDDLLVIVPARGGSTGIPLKNIRPLGGLPLIGWCVEALKAAGMDQVRRILSTDVEEIAEVGRELGLEVPFLRPAGLATAETGLVEVALHAVDWIESNEGGRTPGIVLLLLATQPFRDPAQLRDVLDLFANSEIDGVMSVYAIERSTGVLFYGDKTGRVEALGPPVKTEQRHQVKPILTPSGCFFYLRTDALREQETLYPKNVRAVVTEGITNIDIDSPADWALAEAVFDAGLAWRKP
ncbi:MAG TPA: acylneuraminate cytidylyltransferase family protein [Rhodospirillales bacterium]|jgi:CMP-N-acetylneuraminic acid synthetase|nr:acylneuraminate cytidylyltransferase family protein [Rhodospirillales bacterium]